MIIITCGLVKGYNNNKEPEWDLVDVLEELFPGLLFYELRKELKQKINDENEKKRITKRVDRE